MWSRRTALGTILCAACRRGRPGRALDLDGRPVDPLAAAAPATVLLFTATSCPIANRYAPEVRRLYEAFAPRGVAFWLVYPDRDTSPAAAREHARAYGYPFPAVRDPEHALVRASGATVTPEAAVFARGRLVYRGRIDDRFVDFGRERATPTRRDLHDALEAVLAGRAIATTATEAIGCSIP